MADTKAGTLAKPEVYHGWFSGEQVNIVELAIPEQNSVFVYHSKSSGGLVPVSHITIEKEHGTSFEDMIYMGEVTGFVSSMKKNKAEEQFPHLPFKLNLADYQLATSFNETVVDKNSSNCLD